MTTPRKRAPRTRRPAAPAVQQPESIDYHDDEPQWIEPPRFPVAMLLMTIALAVTSTLAVRSFFDDRNSPEPTPVVAPVNNLSAFTAPITAKLSTDKAKAAIIDDAYTGLCAAIAGKTGERLTSSRIFEAAHAAFLDDLDALGGVAVGAEIDQAIGSYLGMTKGVPVVTLNAAGGYDVQSDPGWEPIAFDASHRVKLVEITAAIAKAAEAAQ
jgi:hypothetical protein